MRVDKNVGQGKAKITMSFEQWKEGNVSAAAYELPVPEPKKQ